MIGSSCAYHLSSADPGIEIGVIEKDPTYQFASSALSAGNARVQFSLETNIRISMHTFDVLTRFEEEMEVGGIAPDVGFRAEGNLFVVDERRRHSARVALKRQQELGCRSPH